MSPGVIALILTSSFIGITVVWSLIKSTLHIYARKKEFKYGKLMYNTVTKETIKVNTWFDYDVLMYSTNPFSWEEDLLYKKAGEALKRSDYRD